MAKPSSKIDWTDGSALKATEPTSGKKLLGWTENERPPFQFINWLFYNINEWIIWFEERVDFHDASANYDAIVGAGAGCTHATLQEAIDDATAGWRIIVLDNAVINTRVGVSVSDIEITFKPGVVYSKGSDTVAMEYSAARVTVHGGRFTGFTGGGDIVHRLMSGADYVTLMLQRFGIGTTTDVDDSAVTAGKKAVVVGSHIEV